MTNAVTSNDGGGVAIKVNRTTVDDTVGGQGDGVTPVVDARSPVDDVTWAKFSEAWANLIDEVLSADNIENLWSTSAGIASNKGAGQGVITTVAIPSPNTDDVIAGVDKNVQSRRVLQATIGSIIITTIAVAEQDRSVQCVDRQVGVEK